MQRLLQSLACLAAAFVVAAGPAPIAAAQQSGDTGGRIRSTRSVVILPNGQVIVQNVARDADAFRPLDPGGGANNGGNAAGLPARALPGNGVVPQVQQPELLIPGLAGPELQDRQIVNERRLPGFVGFLGAGVPQPPGILLVTDFGDGSRVRLTWSDDFVGEDYYRIERQTAVAGVWGPSRFFTSDANVVDVVDNPGLGMHRYRVAVNAWGGASDFGNWVTLTVNDPQPNNPPDDPGPGPIGGLSAPSNLMAVDAGNRRVLLTWTDNSDTELGFQIERNPPLPEGPNQVAANIAAMLDTPGPGSFQYRVRAFNETAESSWTPWVMVMVSDIAPEPPSDPLAVSQGDASRVRFTWTDNSNNETGFLAVRESFDGVNWGSADTFAIAANTVVLNDAPGLGRHRYRVRAANGVGASEFTPWAEVTVSQIAPTAPTDLAATDMGDGLRTQLTWADRANNELVFDIEREQFSGGQWGSSLVMEALADRESFVDAPGIGQWRYRIRARNDAGASVWTGWTQVTVAMIAPTPPQNLLAADVLNSAEVQLSWVDTSSNETSFELSRDTQFGAGWINPVTFTISANTTTYRDSPGVGVYRYRLRAINSAGASAYTAWTQVGVVLQPPAAPSGLAAVDQGNSSSVRLTWNDNSNNESGFDLQRQQQLTGGNWSGSTTTSLSANLTQRTESPGVGTWRYRIRSKNTAGTSAYTGWATVTVVNQVPPPPPAPSGLLAHDGGNRRAVISWNDNSTNETGFELERQPSFAEGSIVLGANVTGYVDQSGPGTFNYRVRALSSAGASAWTGYAAVTVQETPPAAPSGLTAADAGNENDATLTWTDNSFNESAFRIERQSQVGAAWGASEFLTASTDSTTYRDDPGAGTHRYRIAATNAAGDSTWTAWATVVITSGWTQFTPSADTRIVYVSSSEGNDANDGLSEATPKRTIAAGYALLRHGFPDWLLLKRGDVWDEGFGWKKNGRSSTELMVVGSYGAHTDRPLIRTAGNGLTFTGGGGAPATMEHIAFTSFELQPRNRQITDAWNGILFLRPGTNILLEDIKVTGYKDNVNIQGEGTGLFNVRIRRSIIADCHSTGIHSQGLFADNVHGFTVDECLIDRNGWAPGVADATVFNHNMYIRGKMSGVIIRNCIVARASSHGIAVNRDVVIENNLVIDNPIGILARTAPSRVEKNVIIGGRDISPTLPRGTAIDILPVWPEAPYPPSGPAIVAHNLIMNKTASGSGPAIGITFNTSINSTQIEVSNNVVFNWGPGTSLSVGAANGGQTDTTAISANTIVSDRSGTLVAQSVPHGSSSRVSYDGNKYWSTGSPSTWFLLANTPLTPSQWEAFLGERGEYSQRVFPDTTRTLAMYNAAIGGTPSHEDFIDRARSQSRANWDARLTAKSANAWLRTGFGIPEN